MILRTNTGQPFAAVASTDRSRQHLRPTQTDPNIAHGLAHPQPFRLISVPDYHSS